MFELIRKFVIEAKKRKAIIIAINVAIGNFEVVGFWLTRKQLKTDLCSFFSGLATLDN